MSTLTRDELEDIFFRQLTNFRGYANLPEPERLTLLQQLSPQINPINSLTEGLEGIPHYALTYGEGAIEMGRTLITGARHLINRFDPEFTGATEEQIRLAAAAAADAVDKARNPSFMDRITDFFYAVSKAVSFDWPPFSMDSFNEAMAIAPVRRQGIAVYEAIRPLLGTNAAYAMSGIQRDNEMRPGAILPFVAPNTPEAQALQAYTETHPAEPEQNHFEMLLQRVTENPLEGTLYAAGGVALLKFLGVPVSPSNVWRAARGTAIAGFHAGAGAVDVMGGTARTLGSIVGAARHPLQTIQHLPQVSTALAQRTLTLEASRTSVGAARYGARWLGRIGVIVGFIPLVGGLWSTGESIIFGNRAMAAHNDGALTDEEVALVSAALTAHAALGFGGFISGGFDEAQLMALATNERLAPYLPPSIVQVVGDLMAGDNTALTSALQRPDYVVNGTLPAWDNDSAVYLQFNLAIEAFSRGAIGENHPMIQALIEDRLSLLDRIRADRNLPAMTAEERTAAIASFRVAAMAEGQILQDMRADLTTQGAGTQNIAWAFENRMLSLRYEDVTSADRHLIPNTQSIPSSWLSEDQTAAHRQHMTAQELANDLLQRGPVYWRLMDQALSRGETLEDFSEDVRMTLDRITASYITQGRAALIYEFETPSPFGGMATPYATLANAREWDRFEALDGHLQTIFASLEQNLQTSTESLNTVMRAYFVREGEGLPTYSEMALALEHNTYLINWLEARGEDVGALRTQFTRDALTTPDATFNYENSRLWAPFFNEVKVAGSPAADAYLTALETSVAQAEASYGLIAPLILSFENVDQAILATEQAILQIYALPDPSILPDATAQPELAAVLRQAAAIRALVEATPDSNALFASAEFTTTLHSFMVESQGVLTNTPTTTQQTASLTDEQILSVLAAQSGVAAPALVAFSSVTSIAAPIDVAVANGLVPLTTGQMVVAGHSVG